MGGGCQHHQGRLRRVGRDELLGNPGPGPQASAGEAGGAGPSQRWADSVAGIAAAARNPVAAVTDPAV